jgi:ABC-type nickel/cobalt efflux system permease component RcnA
MYLPQRFHFGGSGGSSAQFQFARALLAFLLFCLAFEWLFSTPSLPRSLSRSLVSPQSACGKEENNYQQDHHHHHHQHHHGRRYSLQNSSFCIGDWTSDCFPRVQGICFSSDKVR